MGKLIVCLALLLTSLSASANPSAPKSFLKEYCPSHSDDSYCVSFSDQLASKDQCCKEVADNLTPQEQAAYAPTWLQRKFGRPAEIYDLCVLGPVLGGVAYCD
ncbi:MAG: hypothetical protein ACXVB9_15850 [Bdellovibrionota bacterium]